MLLSILPHFSQKHTSFLIRSIDEFSPVLCYDKQSFKYASERILLMNYKHIIFDFGNVLATFQSDDLLRSYCNREDLPILKNAIYHNWQALDEGSIPYEEYQEETLHLLPDCLHDTARKCFATWYQHMIPIQPVWDMIHRLKEQHTGLYILSNAPIFFEEHADFFEITRLFDGAVYSGSIKK